MYNQYGGVVLDEEEGAHIAKTLGDKKVSCTELGVCNQPHQSCRYHRLPSCRFVPLSVPSIAPTDTRKEPRYSRRHRHD